MKSAIRMAVVVMMAGASTIALATAAGDPSSYERASDELTQTKFETSADANDDQDAGHGSGEPGRSETMTTTDEASSDKAAIAEYNQQNYVNQTWMATP